MDIDELPEEVLIEKTITFRPALVAIAGGLIAGQLLHHVLLEAEAAGDPESWVSLEPQRIQKETGLSEAEQRSARQRIVHRKLVEEKLIDWHLALRLNLAEIRIALGRVLRATAKRENSMAIERYLSRA